MAGYVAEGLSERAGSLTGEFDKINLEVVQFIYWCEALDRNAS